VACVGTSLCNDFTGGSEGPNPILRMTLYAARPSRRGLRL